MRKFDAIDLLPLYTEGNSKAWNEMLHLLHINGDINSLVKVRYQIQAGMDDLVKQKLDDEKIVTFFLRLNKSLEDTAKLIIKARNPLPNDSALSIDKTQKSLDAKRKRDEELREFLRRSAY